MQIQGDQNCVPKGNLDELWSTLAHLVRNAIAHGIESAHERVAPATQEGLIVLNANVFDAKLTVSVSDDGRGIDWSALERKLPPVEASMNDNNRVELLFRERTSATAEVSDLAGHG